MQKIFKFSALALATFSLAACSNDPIESETAKLASNKVTEQNSAQANQLDEMAIQQKVAGIIAALSVEQKVSLVTGTGFKVDNIGGSSKVPGAAGSTFAIPALDIPSMVLADGPAGVRISPTRENDDKTYYATAFPIATVLASTWDTDLVQQVGNAMGEEVKEYGVDIFLAPGMNIHYNPLGGRNFEYYSEDPFLSGNLAAAIVNGIESNGVGATIKHFALNSAETSRMWLDANVNERALREIYLKGFEIAVKQSQPWAIMSSYNKINGDYTSQDEKLLTKVLRDEWGFEGIVMTDWFAGDNAIEQMQAGNDLIMPGMPDQREALVNAVKTGELSESVLDRNLSRILTVLFHTPVYQQYQYSDQPDLIGHADIARQAAAEGIILLKNQQQTLPLAGDAKVAAFGNTSYDFLSGGAGSGDVNEAYTVSLVDGLKNSNLPVNEGLKKAYLAHIEQQEKLRPPKKNFFELVPPLAEFTPSDALIQQVAEQASIGLITIGRNSGEFFDRKVESDFDLNADELALIKRVSAAFHAKNKKVVVILNIGNVIETASWRDQVDAIVLPWQGGQEAGNAVADVLSGRVNPSAKLATSFPLKYADLASAEQFPGYATSEQDAIDPYIGLFVGKESQLDYTDGIYVGYRYYDTFKVNTAYEFGYGLSYTQFAYSPLTVTPGSNAGNYSVSLNVSNTGKTAGKEVVQLYLSAPNHSMDKPLKELKGFSKTALLAPGEATTVNFSLSAEDLASFSVAEQAWVADAGEYLVQVGSSSKNTQSQGKFKLSHPINLNPAKTEFKALTPLTDIKP